MREGVGRAQVAEVLAAEPAVAVAAAAHEAGDVRELTVAGTCSRADTASASAAMRASGTAATPTLAEACTAA